jgi:hypothetical protein
MLTGLTPAGRRRIATALGLALAVALKRVGKFEAAEVCAWRGVPDAAYVGGEKIIIELGSHADAGAVDAVAEEFRKKWD